MSDGVNFHLDGRNLLDTVITIEGIHELKATTFLPRTFCPNQMDFAIKNLNDIDASDKIEDNLHKYIERINFVYTDYFWKEVPRKAEGGLVYSYCEVEVKSIDFEDPDLESFWRYENGLDTRGNYLKILNLKGITFFVEGFIDCTTKFFLDGADAEPEISTSTSRCAINFQFR
jgi:hypothetical protein